MGKTKEILDEREFAKNSALDEEFQQEQERDEHYERKAELEKVAEEEIDNKYEGLKPEDDIFDHSKDEE